MPARRITQETTPTIQHPGPISQGRVALNQSAVIGATWEPNGYTSDPGAVTVTITRDNGTVLVNAGIALGSGGSRTYALTPAQTAQLDLLTVVWTGADGSSVTTYEEVVGGFLFSVALARTRSPLQDTTGYSTESIMWYRNLAEMALEDICGVAFVPRYLSEEVSISGYGVLTGSRRRIRALRGISTWQGNGAVRLASLSGLRIVNGSQIYMPTLWNWFARPIVVSYEHGYSQPPPRVARAALELARRWLVESPWDERLTGFRSREGGQMTILTASHSDAFDIPEVVAVADTYGTPAIA